MLHCVHYDVHYKLSTVGVAVGGEGRSERVRSMSGLCEEHEVKETSSYIHVAETSINHYQ